MGKCLCYDVKWVEKYSAKFYKYIYVKFECKYTNIRLIISEW